MLAAFFLFETDLELIPAGSPPKRQDSTTLVLADLIPAFGFCNSQSYLFQPMEIIHIPVPQLGLLLTSAAYRIACSVLLVGIKSKKISVLA